MKGSLLKISLLTALLPLGLCALPEAKQPTLEQKAPCVPVCDHYKIGYNYGKKLLLLFSQPDTPELMNQTALDKEILRLMAILGKENPSTIAHKNAFADYKTYNKGLKDALASYVPSAATDLETQGKNYAMKLARDMADIIIKAPDMATVRTEVSALVAKTAHDVQKNVPTMPKVTFSLDVNHPHYKEGYALGKQSCEWFILEAQGKAVSEDDQIAMQKRTHSFIYSSQQGKSQEEVIKGSLQYLSGYKKALEEFNLEETLATHKTPQEQAEKLRIGFKFALQSTIGGLDSLQNPNKGFDAFGKAYQDAAQDMNKAQKA